MGNQENAARGTPPAEGRPDLGIPGADRDDVPMGGIPDRDLPGRQDDLPEHLGERIYGGDEQGIATGPDIKPDVEIPDESM